MKTRNLRRGSVLMVALLLAMVMAVAVASYVALSLHTLKQSTRSAHFNNALNVAEAGLEHAMWALNNSFTASPLTWVSGGSSDHPTCTRTGSLSSPDLAGVKGAFTIHIENAYTVNDLRQKVASLKAAGVSTDGIQTWLDDHMPIVHARGAVQPQVGPVLTKALKLKLSIRSPWDNGLVGRKRVDLNGGDIGSYDSRATGTVPTSLAAMGYGITVASPTSIIGDVAIGTPADIRGHLSVGIGAADAATFLASIKGSITGPATPSGTSIDANLVSYDFDQSYEEVAIPTAADLGARTGLTVNSYTALPAATTTGENAGWTVIGDPTGATVQRFSLIGDLTTRNILVKGPVQIVITGEFGPEGLFVLDGSKSIPQIEKTGKLSTTEDVSTGKGWAEVYVGGDITLNGAPGTLNAGSRPPLLKIFSSLTEAMYKAGNTQEITLNGDANITALVYAPFATVKFNGGGCKGFFAGALVADTITIGGNKYPFVYDVSAANEDIVGFRLNRWIEFVRGPDPVSY